MLSFLGGPNAALVATRRDAFHVLRPLTPLGIALLDRSV